MESKFHLVRLGDGGLEEITQDFQARPSLFASGRQLKFLRQLFRIAPEHPPRIRKPHDQKCLTVSATSMLILDSWLQPSGLFQIMSEPKIEVGNLPSSPGPKSPTGSPVPKDPKGPSGPSVPPDPRARRSTASAAIFKFGFFAVLAVASFFIACSVILQSRLKQTKNETVELRSQLEQARSEAGKAQANARGLSDERAKLQTRLEEVEGEGATAKANAEKASDEAAKLRAQLEQARSETAAAKANAQKASDELAKLRPQSKQTGAHTVPINPMAANVKEMPLSVSFRKALLGDGNAVVLQNTSSQTLSVNVKFADSTASRSQEYHLVLDAGAIKELGSLGAWKLASGDKLRIESAAYDPILKTAP